MIVKKNPINPPSPLCGDVGEQYNPYCENDLNGKSPDDLNSSLFWGVLEAS
jgi:hypothetical protein